MNLRPEIAALREQLVALSVPGRAEHEKRYLKSELEFLGAPIPEVRRLARSWAAARRGVERAELLALVDALWATRVHELRSLAIALLERFHARLDAADLDLIERLLREAGTWAHVDWLSTGVLGELVERFPAVRRKLPAWSRDENFWIRRASMLALLVPLREGGGDWELFQRLATPQLEDGEFFIRKAIGWILRETAKKRPERVREFVTAHAARMSGLTFREATRSLPDAMRAELEALRGGLHRGAPARDDAKPSGRAGGRPAGPRRPRK